MVTELRTKKRHMARKAHHYIPRYYLKGFTESQSGSIIWVYEKGKQRRFRASINNVAHENYFYAIKRREGQRDTDAVETYLAEQVEEPANPVIQKIRNYVLPTQDERVQLSLYMDVMLKRVPQHRERIIKASPAVAASVNDRWDRAFDDAIRQQPERFATIEKNRELVRQIVARFAESPPSETKVPRMSFRIARAFYEMTWQFLTYRKQPVFVTNDNPLFFFEGIGIGKQESEITFPISSEIVLWGTHRQDLKEGFFDVGKRIVDEVNDRAGSVATRFLYYCQDADWVVELANRQRYTLNRIV